MESSNERVIARIALVRHGRSAHVQRAWIDNAGFVEWLRAYEKAGIDAQERVPEEIAKILAETTLFVASDAQRAIETARHLAGDREVVTSPLLRELELPVPQFGQLQFPLSAWALFIGLRVLLETMRSRFPSPLEVERADQAMAWLTELSDREALVSVVTHGTFRRELASRLIGAGWKREFRTSATKHWSVWMFVRGAGASGPR